MDLKMANVLQGDGRSQEDEEKLLREIMTPFYPEDPYETLGERNFATPRVVPVSEKGTPVQEFYRDAVVFVTGGTGFIGMVLIEKLIRSCPHLNRIYVLIRAKKGKSAEERFDASLEDSLFKRLRHEVPHYRTKISVVSGSIDEDENMGLSMEDRKKLAQEVNVIFHCAATVRFDEKLSVAMTINLLGTRNVMNLAKEMKNLKAFIHVSTAYSNCLLKRIEEKVYPNKYSYHEILKKMELNKTDELDQMEETILKEWPNTYTFSKSLTEIMVNEEHANLPIGIVRPSVVTSTYREPVKGWSNNLFGPNGMLVAYACGIVHVLPGHKRFNYMDAIPADFVVNGALCSAYDVAKNFKTNKSSAANDIPVFNFVNGNRNIQNWGQIKKIFHSQCDMFPFTYTLWYPFGINTPHYPLYVFLTFLLHTIPGYVLDFILKIMGINFSLTKFNRRISDTIDKVQFFFQGTWSFGYRKVDDLWKSLTPEDREIFLFDVEKASFEKGVKILLLGIRTYFLKEDLGTLPAARKRMERLYWAHKCLVFLLKAFAAYLMYSLVTFCFSSYNETNLKTN